MGIFNVGVSGLNAASIGLQTTSHNISNASTDGYVRQTIVQTTNTPFSSGAGFIGQGTSVETVKRAYSQYLTGQVLSAQAGASSMDSYLAQVQQIDNLLGDASAGLSPALAQFFKGVQEATANPSSIASRQSMLSASQSLVAQFQAVDGRLTDIRLGTNSQISSEVTTINAYATKIAEINQNIINASATGNGQPPNDLLDQRDKMVSDLNKEIRVQTVSQADGTYSVFIGNGQPLVVGTVTSQLQALPSTTDPQRTTVAVASSSNGGKPIYIPESLISGGKLGGLIAFRNESLDPVENGMGRIALTLANDFNTQHQLGMDLDGKLGGKYFDMTNMVAQPTADANNSGSGAPTISISNYASLTTSDYRLAYTGSTYTLTRLSDNTVTDLGSTSPLTTADGFTINTSVGSPNANDSWLIRPTRDGAKNMAMFLADPRSIALAAPVRTSAATTNAGTGTIDAGTVVDTTNGAFAAPGKLTPPVLVKFNLPATTYTVYDNSNPTAPVALTNAITYTAGSAVFPVPAGSSLSGLPLDYGYRMKINGSPAAGDQFTADYNSSGISDNRNGVLLGALQTTSRMEATASSPAGTATYATAYAQLVSYVGAKTNEVTVTGQAQQTLTDQANNSLQQLSGVNLDEEAANLLRYQQAYQAASKMISLASKLFDNILALGG
ncbi:MAG TPA: flagellar hook-associated protein FlgK [Rhodocyclaceae bacterium]|nr:flagellar hook-associated protein FlgK [Rhodocyclaceae bacterium]